MTTTMANEIRSFVRESVHEEVVATLREIRASLVPFVSKSEAAEIKKLYKKPSREVARTL